MDDTPLHADSLSMDDSDGSEALFLAFRKIFLKERRDLFWKKSMKINPVRDGNSNRHETTEPQRNPRGRIEPSVGSSCFLTASKIVINIALVSFPVCVFCWLGW
jgi:hypothetical protein